MQPWLQFGQLICCSRRRERAQLAVAKIAKILRPGLKSRLHLTVPSSAQKIGKMIRSQKLRRMSSSPA